MKQLAKYAVGGIFVLLAVAFGILALMGNISGYWIVLSIVLLGLGKTVLWSEMSLFAKKGEEK